MRIGDLRLNAPRDPETRAELCIHSLVKPNNSMAVVHTLRNYGQLACPTLLLALLDKPDKPAVAPSPSDRL